MHYSPPPNYSAYSSAYQTLSKTRQLVMLYDGAIKFIMQAKEAIREGRIEDRFNLTVKAMDIIQALQGCLDFEQGGEIALILNDYYSGLDARILQLNWKNEESQCDPIIRDLKRLRDAWDQIDRKGAEGAISANATDKQLDVNNTAIHDGKLKQAMQEMPTMQVPTADKKEHLPANSASEYSKVLVSV